MKRIIPYLFSGKEKKLKRDRKNEEKRDKQDNALWFCCGKMTRKGGKREDEGRALNRSCRSSISALNVSPCQNVMTWTELISPLTNSKKKQSLLCRGVKQSNPPPQLFSSLAISKGLFLGWEMEGERTTGEEMTARQVHLPPTTTNWSLSAIKSNNNNKIELSNVPLNAQPQQWLQQ